MHDAHKGLSCCACRSLKQVASLPTGSKVIWLWVNKKVPKCNPGKWKRGLDIAFFSSDFILNHTHLAEYTCKTPLQGPSPREPRGKCRCHKNACKTSLNHLASPKAGGAHVSHTPAPMVLSRGKPLSGEVRIPTCYACWKCCPCSFTYTLHRASLNRQGQRACFSRRQLYPYKPAWANVEYISDGRHPSCWRISLISTQAEAAPLIPLWTRHPKKNMCLSHFRPGPYTLHLAALRCAKDHEVAPLACLHSRGAPSRLTQGSLGNIYIYIYIYTYIHTYTFIYISELGFRETLSKSWRPKNMSGGCVEARLQLPA